MRQTDFACEKILLILKIKWVKITYGWTLTARLTQPFAPVINSLEVTFFRLSLVDTLVQDVDGVGLVVGEGVGSNDKSNSLFNY